MTRFTGKTGTLEIEDCKEVPATDGSREVLIQGRYLTPKPLNPLDSISGDLNAIFGDSPIVSAGRNSLADLLSRVGTASFSACLSPDRIRLGQFRGIETAETAAINFLTGAVILALRTDLEPADNRQVRLANLTDGAKKEGIDDPAALLNNAFKLDKEGLPEGLTVSVEGKTAFEVLQESAVLTIRQRNRQR